MRAILSVIAAYSDGKMALPEFSAQLIVGHEGFVNPPERWTEGFMKHWIVIEEINAILLDGAELSEEVGGYLQQAVDDLRDLVKAHLPKA
ncbi:MAG: hypothetical protein ACYTG5_19065 [Planctomycetota bacterium]